MNRISSKRALLTTILDTPEHVLEMSDSGLKVPVMTEPPRRYNVTITVEKDGDCLPNPAEFAVAAGEAASARAAGVVQRAHY